MKNGFKILWSEKAAQDLSDIISYLQNEWSNKEVKSFVRKLDARLELLSYNPRLYPKSPRRKELRRSVLTKQTVVYYKIKMDAVEVVTLFNTSQNPKKLPKN